MDTINKTKKKEKKNYNMPPLSRDHACKGSILGVVVQKLPHHAVAQNDLAWGRFGQQKNNIFNVIK
jgi:hypothetical protein